MNTLLDNKDLIFEIKRKVEQNDDLLYFHVVIPNIQITAETITIVMTASNRSNQTYWKYNVTLTKGPDLICDVFNFFS